MTNNKFYIAISWISVIISIGFFLLLGKELLFEEFSLSEIAVTPIVLGIILLIDFIISFIILKQKIEPNIIILIFQIIIIAFCLYLIYYYNSGMSVKVDRVINL
jgi:hypothetical protein